MIIKILAVIFGVLIFGTGIFYLAKERDDKDSRTIYTVISAVGGILALIGALMLIFG